MAMVEASELAEPYGDAEGEEEPCELMEGEWRGEVLEGSTRMPMLVWEDDAGEVPNRGEVEEEEEALEKLDSTELSRERPDEAAAAGGAAPFRMLRLGVVASFEATGA